MLFDLLKDLLEVAVLLGAVLFTGALKLASEDFHPVKASRIERFDDIQGSKKERAGTAGGIKNGGFLNGVIESTKQFWPLAVLDHVLGELADIQVEGDEVVDVPDFTACKLGPDFLVPLPPRRNLPPDFRRQSIFG